MTLTHTLILTDRQADLSRRDFLRASARGEWWASCSV